LTTAYSNFYFQEEAEQKNKVHIRLNAADLGDFPASYLIPALKPHEFPAVGVYVDPRIVPGFMYRVRPIENEVKLMNVNENDCHVVQQLTKSYSPCLFVDSLNLNCSQHTEH
jgi:hypothetical protein